MSAAHDRTSFFYWALPALMLLAGCDSETTETVLGVCCAFTLAPLLLPLWVRLEKAVPGLGYGLVALAAFSMPVLLWDQVQGGALAKLGAWMVLATDFLYQDLIAALLPNKPLETRAMLGAMLLGGSAGAVVGLSSALAERGRGFLGCLFVPAMGVLGLYVFQQGPSYRSFAPHEASTWPALAELERPSPLPLRWIQVQADDGTVTRRNYPPMRLQHLLPRPLQGQGGCAASVSRQLQIVDEDVSRALWAAILGEPPPAEAAGRRTGMTWFEAAGFANRLSEARGLTPAYTIRPGEVTWDTASDGLRLPTWAELELAAAAGAAPERGVWAWDVWEGEASLSCGEDPGIRLSEGRAAHVSTEPPHVVWVPGGAQGAAGDAVDPAVGLRLVRSAAPLR